MQSPDQLAAARRAPAFEADFNGVEEKYNPGSSSGKHLQAHKLMNTMPQSRSVLPAKNQPVELQDKYSKTREL
jgi:hypothetical protein